MIERGDYERFYKDEELLGKVFFPHYFSLKFSDFHKDLHAIFRVSPKKVAVAAPRGSGKTTNITFLQVMKRLAYGLDKYILIVFDSLNPQGVLFLEGIRNELKYNDDFITFFGLKLVKDIQDEIIVNTRVGDIMIQTRGIDQATRGAKFREKRPTLIIFDDIENEDTRYSAEARNKVKRNFWGKFIPALDRKAGKAWVIGTIMHKDSLLNNLLNSNTWITRRYSVLQDGKPLWKEYMTIDDIEATRKEYQRHGLLDLFYTEYMNTPVNPESKPFNRGDVMYYYDIPPTVYNNSYKVILTDLAISQGKRAHYSVVMPVLITRDNEVFVLDYVYGKMLPDEFMDKVFMMCNKYNIRDVGIEQVAFQKSMRYWLVNEGRRRGILLNIVELKTGRNKGDKVRRIMALQPLISSHGLYIKRDMTDLIMYLENWQPETHDRDDVIDTLAYSVQFIDKPKRALDMMLERLKRSSRSQPLDRLAGY